MFCHQLRRKSIRLHFCGVECPVRAIVRHAANACGSQKLPYVHAQSRRARHANFAVASDSLRSPHLHQRRFSQLMRRPGDIARVAAVPWGVAGALAS